MLSPTVAVFAVVFATSLPSAASLIPGDNPLGGCSVDWEGKEAEEVPESLSAIAAISQFHEVSFKFLLALLLSQPCWVPEEPFVMKWWS